MTKESPTAIEVDGFGKRYGKFTAVHDLSFHVDPGEIMGLVGSNGAGKTTTLRALSGLLRPTQGNVRVCGHNLRDQPLEAKRSLAYIPDTTQPYELLTVKEHLQFIAMAYRVADAESKYQTLLEELELGSKVNEAASALSRGMQQKLSLACAFLREPRVIILDEPLTGLDPRGIRNIKSSIRRRAESGTAFLLSSHLLELVEALCDRVLILHQGKKVALGTLDQMRDLRAGHESAKLEDLFFAITEHPS